MDPEQFAVALDERKMGLAISDELHCYEKFLLLVQGTRSSVRLVGPKASVLVPPVVAFRLLLRGRAHRFRQLV